MVGPFGIARTWASLKCAGRPWNSLANPAAAAQNAAQMAAMDNATKNSAEVIETLTLTMNKVRQAAITREIIEVVSGAEALSTGAGLRGPVSGGGTRRVRRSRA